MSYQIKYLTGATVVTEMMKRARGKSTDQEVERCAKIGGTFGKDLDKLVTNAGKVSFEETWSSRHSHKKRQVQDIKAFVKEYRSDNLFAAVPGRYHAGLKKFRYENTIEEPIKFGRKLRKLSQDMDKWEVFAGLEQ